MQRNNARHQCLSLQEIKAFLGNEISEPDKAKYTQHFATCELCAEVKDSFATVNQMSIEEDVSALKEEVFSTINRRSLTTRRRFIARIAAGILLPFIGISTLFYWNNTANERLYQAHFESYPIMGGETRGGELENYDHLSLPKMLTAALKEYRNKNYQASIPHFKTYLNEQPQNNKAFFLYSLANLEVNNIDTAIPNLEKVRHQKDDMDLYEDATWYLALAQVKNKKNKIAIDLLNELIDGKSTFYGKKAIALKHQL
ncbi:MAG: hypothetical protein AB8G86_24465 [Saprospiraceae bacterium]